MRIENIIVLAIKSLINAPDLRETGEGISGISNEPERGMWDYFYEC